MSTRPVIRKSSAIGAKLSPSELNLLKDCETKIARYLRAGLEAGEAMRQMDTVQPPLFRVYGFKTLEAYLWERWGISTSRKRQLTAAAETVRVLKEHEFSVLPSNENQIRCLSWKPPEVIVDTWRLVAGAHHQRRRVTAQIVEDALTQVESQKMHEIELQREDYQENTEAPKMNGIEHHTGPESDGALLTPETAWENIQRPLEDEPIADEPSEAPALLRPIIEPLTPAIELVLDFLPQGDDIENPGPEFLEALNELDSVIHPLIDRLSVRQ